VGNRALFVFNGGIFLGIGNHLCVYTCKNT
jgi:hypothetical protein